MQPLRTRVDLGAMAMKGYSVFPKAPALLEPHHQIVYCHIQDTRWGVVLPLCREAVGVFYSPSRLGKISVEEKSTYASVFKVTTATGDATKENPMKTIYNPSESNFMRQNI